MKKIFRTALIIAFGFGVAASFTACHNSSDDEVEKKEVTVTPKNSIKGVVLDGDGNALTGAKVTLQRSGSSASNVSVNSNSFVRGGLADGAWTVTVSKDGYKTVTATLNLAVSSQVVDGRTVRVGQQVFHAFYLTKEVKSKVIKLGNAAVSDDIVIETTTQDDGTGRVVPSTDPAVAKAAEVLVHIQTPVVSGDALTSIEKQLKDQGGSLDDFSVYLTNIASLEDAKKLAEDNHVTRSTTDLPGGLDLLAGVGVNCGPFAVELPNPITCDVTITLPDNNTKNAIKLFRSISGTNWTALTTGDGIKSIDYSQDNVVIIRLSRLQSQSFAVGVRIEENQTASNVEAVTSTPVVNNTGSTMNVSSMNYQSKEGCVMANLVNGPLTDFLRKVVLRKYGVLPVKDVVAVNNVYEFIPAYQLPSTGTLYLLGWQEVLNYRYNVVDANASFETRTYGSVSIYPYAVVPEVIDTHYGGSN